MYYRVQAINPVGFTPSNIVSAITETDPRVVLSLSSLSLEEGGSATYTVGLTGQPSSTVRVTYVSDNSDVTVSPTSLTFRSDNWDVPQSVTVLAAQDADEDHEEATLTHRASSYQSASVQIEVSDDDRPSSGTLTAEFRYNHYEGVIPGVHFGESFEIRVRFSDRVLNRNEIRETQGGYFGPVIGYREVPERVGPDRGLRVTGGTVESIKFYGVSHLMVNVQPSSHGDVTLTLEPLSCNAPGAFCSEQGRGLADRVEHTVRGVGDLPPAPKDLQLETVRKDGQTLMNVSFLGTNVATESRVQWKFPDQEWSDAEEHLRWRSVGPEDRHLAVTARLESAFAYDVRARWESPIGEGPWAYATRPGRPQALWGETISWYQSFDTNGNVNGAEVYIEYGRDLHLDSPFIVDRRLAGSSPPYQVTSSGSSTHTIRAVKTIDKTNDNRYNPRIIKLTLSGSPNTTDRVLVTYAGVDRLPVLDRNGNSAPTFNSLPATFVSGGHLRSSGGRRASRSPERSSVRATRST